MDLSILKEAFLDILFPKFCFGCREEGHFLCPGCEQKLIFSAPSCPVCSKRNFSGVLCPGCEEKSGLRRFISPFSYREALVRDLIHAYKYEGVKELAESFAEMIVKMLNFYNIRIGGNFILMPVPLHRSRQRERGFNQSELLAERLAKRLNCKVGKVLRRVRATEQQIEMDSYEKRRENVAGAFEVTAPEVISGQAVIIIDDVSTSGATIYEAARCLRQAGARTVWAMVVAKG